MDPLKSIKDLPVAERHQPCPLGIAARGLERLARPADAEGDVVEAGRSGGKGLRVGARQLERDVVVVSAGGEEDDASLLAASRLAEAEDVSIEANGRIEVAHEERNVSQLDDPHGGGSVA